MRGLSWLWVVVLLCGCPQKTAEEPLSSLTPKPLTKLAPLEAEDAGVDEREALHRVEAAEVWGEPIPTKAIRLRLDDHGKVWWDNSELKLGEGEGEQALRAGVRAGKPVLLVPSAEVYMAQLSVLLALLDDQEAEVWVQHPEGTVAFPVELKDEPAFQSWLDQITPGRIRIIQRADGLELSTAVGKLPGADPNGPSVPNRGGQLDIATARRGLTRLAERFTTTEDLCIVPSFGTELALATRVMSANYVKMEEPIFDSMCLVYGRLKP